MRCLFATAAAVLALAAPSALGSGGAPVSLSQAREAPTFLVYLQPGAGVTFGARIGRTFSDVSAYRWDGAALSGQRWSARRRLWYWRNSNGRLVTWDGARFVNRTRAPVLVAAWQDDYRVTVR